MKLREEFRVGKPVAEVWAFLDEPERVAGCVPGVEKLTVRGADDLDVVATQTVGPMTATFAASLKIVERVPEKLISFTATGKTVRGAMGNVRAGVGVELRPDGDVTIVVVEGDVALAGALGSVGQKVVARQAGKVTAAFARNLEVALGGSTGESTVPAAMPAVKSIVDTGDAADTRGRSVADPWSKAAAVLSAASVVLSAIALTRAFSGRAG